MGGICYGGAYLWVVGDPMHFRCTLRGGGEGLGWRYLRMGMGDALMHDSACRLVHHGEIRGVHLWVSPLQFHFREGCIIVPIGDLRSSTYSRVALMWWAHILARHRGGEVDHYFTSDFERI